MKINKSSFVVIEEESRQAKVLVMPSVKKSSNNRTYDDESIKEQIQKLNKSIEAGIQNLCFLGHKDYVVNGETGEYEGFTYKRDGEQVAEVERYEISDDNAVYAYIKFLNTPSGDEYWEKVKNRENVDVSIRGTADCSGRDENGEPDGTGYCITTDIDGFDFLTENENPGFPEAGVVYENRNKGGSKMKKGEGPIKESLEEIVQRVMAADAWTNVEWRFKYDLGFNDEELGKAREFVMSKMGASEASGSDESPKEDAAEAAAVSESEEPENPKEEPKDDEKTKAEESDSEEKDGKENAELSEESADKKQCNECGGDNSMKTESKPVKESFLPDEDINLLREVAKSKRSEIERAEIERFVWQTLARESVGGIKISDPKVIPHSYIKKIGESVLKSAPRTKEEAKAAVIGSVTVVAEAVKDGVALVENEDKSIDVKADQGYRAYIEEYTKAGFDYLSSVGVKPVYENMSSDLKKRHQTFMEEKVIKPNEAELMRETARFSKARNLHRIGKVTEAEAVLNTSLSEYMNRSFISTMMNQMIFPQMMAMGLVNGGTQEVRLGPSSQLGQFVEFLTEYEEPVGGKRDPEHRIGRRETAAEFQIKVAWSSLFAERIALAYRYDDESQFWLSRLPLKTEYGAKILARASAYLARNEDYSIHREMMQSSDEYKPLVITNETAQAVECKFGANVVNPFGITIPTDTGSVGAVVMLRRGAATGNAVPGPVVLPRKCTYPGGYDDNGVLQQEKTVWKNAIIFSGADANNPWGVINSKSQVPGWLDENWKLRSYKGTTATFALEPNNGLLFFAPTAISGVDASNRPVIAQYSAVRNFSMFDLDVPVNQTRESYYNNLVTAITDINSDLRSKPDRLAYPDFTLYPEKIGARTIPHASVFSPLTRKEFVKLETGYSDQIVIGDIGGNSQLKTNSRTPYGDWRALISQRGVTEYLMLEPISLKGPLEGITVEDGFMHVTNEKVFEFTGTRLVATPKKVKQDGTVFQFPSTTIYFSGAVPGSGLGI